MTLITLGALLLPYSVQKLPGFVRIYIYCRCSTVENTALKPSLKERGGESNGGLLKDLII